MNKQELIQRLVSRREALGLSGGEVAERSGLTERSVRNALGPQGNPQLSSLLALVDALDMELQLVPKGFGSPAMVEGDASYRPVSTRIGEALARRTIDADAPPPQNGTLHRNLP